MKLTPDEIKKFWELADRNKDGRLTIQELVIAIKRYDPSLKDNVIAGMFCDIDADSDNKISKREFETQMSNARGEQLKKLWSKYDKDRSGHLSRGEAIQLITDFYPADKKDEIVGLLLQYCDPNNDQRITKEEFDAFFG